MAAAFATLKQLAVKTAVEATPAEVLGVQRDIVAGADRLYWLARQQHAVELPEIAAFRLAAHEALARLER